MSRARRTLDESKTTCLLHVRADYLYYKRFKSVEAVVAQVRSSKLLYLPLKKFGFRYSGLLQRLERFTKI